MTVRMNVPLGLSARVQLPCPLESDIFLCREGHDQTL